MSDKCQHASSIVLIDVDGFSVLKCTWGCNQHLIEFDLGNNTVTTYTPAELAALRAENVRLREALEDIAAGDVVYGQQAAEYKVIARAALRGEQ